MLVQFIICKVILRCFYARKFPSLIPLYPKFNFLFGICGVMAACKPVEFEDRVQSPADAHKTTGGDENGRKKDIRR